MATTKGRALAIVIAAATLAASVRIFHAWPQDSRFCYHRCVRARLLLLLPISLATCSSPKRVADIEWTPTSPPDLGAVVARVGEIPVYASQVLAEAKRSGLPPRTALDNLITSSLLAERARQADRRPAPASDPEVESTLVQRLLERELEPTLRAEAMPDSALRPLYERAKTSFVHPRLVEVGMLAIYTGARMARDLREERAQAARELAAWLKSHPPATLEEFAAIARDPAWSSRNVVYDRFLQSPEAPLARKVGEEMVKLRATGESTGLLSDDDGFYIARYVSEKPPQNVTFEQARAKLESGYLDIWRQQRFAEFTARLMQGHHIEAHFERLPRNEQGP
jgi:hypothetical protein